MGSRFSFTDEALDWDVLSARDLSDIEAKRYDQAVRARPR